MQGNAAHPRKATIREMFANNAAKKAAMADHANHLEGRGGCSNMVGIDQGVARVSHMP